MAPPTPAAEPSPEREPRTVEEAQKQITEALDAIDGKRSLHANEATAPKSPPAEKPSTSKAEDYDSAATKCASSCRALDSMKRAVTALCRLTSETDAKCIDARKTLTDNVNKTLYCRCNDS